MMMLLQLYFQSVFDHLVVNGLVLIVKFLQGFLQNSNALEHVW